MSPCGDFCTQVFSQDPQPPFSMNITADVSSIEDTMKLITSIFIRGIEIKYRKDITSNQACPDTIFDGMRQYFMSFGFATRLERPNGSTVPFNTAIKTPLRNYTLGVRWTDKEVYRVSFDVLNMCIKCK